MQSETVKRYITKNVKIFLYHNNTNLVFTAKINFVDDLSCEFIDRYGASFVFLNAEITSIELREGFA